MQGIFAACPQRCGHRASNSRPNRGIKETRLQPTHPFWLSLLKIQNMGPGGGERKGCLLFCFSGALSSYVVSSIHISQWISPAERLRCAISQTILHPNPGIEPGSPALQVDSLPLSDSLQPHGLWPTRLLCP